MFFFKQKAAYERRISDWSSDVCSSDLERLAVGAVLLGRIELARVAVAGHAVALDIAQVCTRALDAVSGKLDDAGFDDDTAAAERRIAIARGEHAAEAGGPADLARPEERRVGNVWVSTWQSRWSQIHKEKKPDYAI